MFDVEKAYDKLWHEGVIWKLKMSGLNEPTIGLLYNYLSNREIQLRVGEVIGRPIKLRAGTPQGSVLSPTLFKIWVHDVPQPTSENTKMNQFADDTATWANGKHPKQVQRKLQHFNNRFNNYCQTWRIKLSTRKTQVIAFYNKNVRDPQQSLSQTINGQRIPPSKNVKYLGVTLDQRLHLKAHHKNMMTELRRRTGMFRKITGTHYSPKADTTTSKKIMHSMIVPITMYAPTITCLRNDRKFREQNLELRKAARLALHALGDISVDYTERVTGIGNSKQRTINQAKSDLSSNNRSESMKLFMEANKPKQANSGRSPLDLIFPIAE